MPWIVRLIPNNDTSLYNSKCATLPPRGSHRLAGGAVARSASASAGRATRSRRSSARAPAACPASPTWAARNIARPRRLPDHRQRQRRGPQRHERSELAEVPQRRRDALARSRRLPADHAAVGHAQRDRSQRRHDPLEDSVRRVSRAGREGPEGHRQRQLRRPDRHRRRPALHRRDELRPEVPRLRQADRQAAVGDDAARRGQRDAVDLHASTAASTSSSSAAAARTARRRAARSSRSRCLRRSPERRLRDQVNAKSISSPMLRIVAGVQFGACRRYECPSPRAGRAAFRRRCARRSCRA